jgi:benzodiazapine receptor
MKLVDVLKLAASIIVCLLAGFLGSLFTTPAIPTWYAALEKPFFTPPSWLFAPAWTALFILMGISFFLVWRKKGHPQFRTALVFFVVQFILNILWSAAFFGLRAPLLGLIEIVVLWIAILLTIIYFFKVSRLAGALLVPYLLWVSFASLLNYYLWILNR